MRTSASRAFFVMLCLLVLGSMGLWYSSIDKYLDPTRWYFWTLNGKEDGFAIVPAAPSGRHIIDIGFLSTAADYKTFNTRCQPPEGIITTPWRGVMLCDSGHLQPIGELGKFSEKFQEALSYFKSRVDGMYAETYWQMFSDAVTHLLAALGVWSLLLSGWWTFRWIRAAPQG
jgi:hypothetical protein